MGGDGGRPLDRLRVWTDQTVDGRRCQDLGITLLWLNCSSVLLVLYVCMKGVGRTSGTRGLLEPLLPTQTPDTTSRRTTPECSTKLGIWSEGSPALLEEGCTQEDRLFHCTVCRHRHKQPRRSLRASSPARPAASWQGLTERLAVMRREVQAVHGISAGAVAWG